MLKSDLRKNGFSERTIEPKHSGISRLWIFLTLFLIAAAIAAAVGIVYYFYGGIDKVSPPHDGFIALLEEFGPLGYFGFFIITMFAYYLLKCFFTAMFCLKINCMKLHLLEINKMPVCLCKEALRVWQHVVINGAPFILFYPLYIFLSVRYMANPQFLLMLIFMIFFMAFDLTLILYVLRVKIRERTLEYISMEYHVYMMTLFDRTYVKLSYEKKKKRRTK